MTICLIQVKNFSSYKQEIFIDGYICLSMFIIYTSKKSRFSLVIERTDFFFSKKETVLSWQREKVISW